MTTITSTPGPQVQGAAQQALYDIMNGDAVSDEVGVSGPGGTDGSSPPAYLTPQALMLYCQTRLQGIDSQIQQSMNQQNQINVEQSSIGQILLGLQGDSAVAGGGVMTSASACQDVEQKLEDLITSIQKNDPGCSQLVALEQLHDSIMATGTGPSSTHGYYYLGDPSAPPTGQTPPPDVNDSHDNAFSSDEITNFTQSLNNINNSLGSGAEMGMIQIQSHMSDRTTAIQLTTSILQAYDDGLSKIVDKIGQ